MKKLLCIFVLSLSSISLGYTLDNANFDEQVLNDNAWSGGTDVAGWDLNFSWSHTQNLPEGDTGGAMTVPAQSGDNTLGLNGDDGDNGGAYVSQILKEDDGTTPVLVQANKTYKVTLWVGRRSGDQGSFAGILAAYLQETSGDEPVNIAEATYDLISQDQNTWTQQVLYLSTGSAPAGEGSELRFMLRNIGDRTETHWHQQVVVDDVTVVASNIAKIVSPTLGQDKVNIDTLLTWEAPDSFIPTGYDVRIGTDPNMTTILATNTTDTSIDASPEGDLDYNKKYYWRVDAIGDTETIIGDVWNFTTIPEAPVFTLQPQIATAASGGEAVFEVSALNTTSYSWYKSADAVAGDDTVVGSGAVLTITDIDLSDEAYYYCIATGPAGSETSDITTLGVERKVAHWTLDSIENNQYLDISGEGHNADPNGVPEIISGAIDNGAVISQPSGWASAGTWNPSEYSGQLTIAMWVKTNGDFGDWRGLMSKRSAWGSDTMMWRLEQDNGSGNVVFGGSGGSIVSAQALPVDQWEHIAVTYNGSVATIYRNGVSSVSGSLSLQNGTDAPIMIGAGQKDADGIVGYIYQGGLDDIQIYNHALSYTDVADLYLASPIANSFVCVEEYSAAYDYDNNCRVDINDFAIIATQWLSCGRYPVSECN